MGEPREIVGMCLHDTDIGAKLEETMQFEKCFLQSMDWVDEEFMIKNETKTADFDSLPEGVREEVNPDTVYACAEEQMALMLENPEVVAQMEACSNDYSAEEMETLGYIALMQLSLKCFKDMITSSCDNQVRIMLGREMEG